MKKILTTLFIITATLFSLTCYAQLPEDKFIIGGLFLRQNESDVEEIYGPPTDVKENKIEKTTIKKYIPGVVVVYKDTTYAIIISTPEVSTESGINTDSKEEDIYKTYGPPDQSYFDPMNNTTRYIKYKHKNPKEDFWKEMMFVIENKKINRIIISEKEF